MFPVMRAALEALVALSANWRPGRRVEPVWQVLHQTLPRQLEIFSFGLLLLIFFTSKMIKQTLSVIFFE